MNHVNYLQNLKGKLIVSCQAFPGEALYGSDIMCKMAAAAKDGGAAGIRANSPGDISAIAAVVDLPLIGLWKCAYPDSDVYITPTFADVEAVIASGANIVAVDGTLRQRPNGEMLNDIVVKVKANHSCLLMADISTVEEGLHAAEIGFDIISTTLSGYTQNSPHSDEPDFKLVAELSNRVSIPVFAEGRITTPEQAVRMLESGAFAVVVGGAITRPQLITSRFVTKINLMKQGVNQ